MICFRTYAQNKLFFKQPQEEIRFSSSWEDRVLKLPGIKNENANLKIMTLVFTFIIIASSFTVCSDILETGMIPITNEFEKIDYQLEPCEVKTIITEAGTWVSFDTAAVGTPAEVHVTVSDTSGITIVADFHGFWRNNYTFNTTLSFDNLEMPDVCPMQEPGKPMVPSLFEYIEVPHEPVISIEILDASYGNISDYNIRPAPFSDIPDVANDTLVEKPSTNETLFIDNDVYENDTYFPGHTTSLRGESNTTPWIMRGHRLLEFGIFPLQYNPVTGNLTVCSQMIIKLNYDQAAQIEPVRDALQSPVFDLILARNILYYGSCDCITPYVPDTVYGIPEVVYNGAEYLIITTDEYKHQADRLAEWKNRKGVRAKVETINPNPVAGEPSPQNQVNSIIDTAYTEWFPVPTYVLLIGDVEDIPANYQVHHHAPQFIQSGLFAKTIASDLGYFNIEGYGFFPEMIYGRMSVDSVEQAENIVDKTLQYEQDPVYTPTFYDNILFAGYFNDRNDPMDGVEDANYPFTFMLELIRQYLKDQYTTHVNYSCMYMHYEYPGNNYAKRINYPLAELKFADPIYQEVNGVPVSSYLVADSVDPDFPNFGWIASYDDAVWYSLARGNITPNFNDGRFLVVYNGHGGSRNMIQYIAANALKGENPYVRDHVEGWDAPYYDTSFFTDLTNGAMTPLVINLACSTGWYDGEDDQEYLYLGDSLAGWNGHNLFEDYATESFAEEITRLEGGAIAAIAPSRPAYSRISRYLIEALTQAFWPKYNQIQSWPGYSQSFVFNQPIYEIGAALLFGKFHAAKKVGNGLAFKDETTWHEYHLFGDPETQLWTERPSNFSVSYPVSIGTSDSQRFVVNVHDGYTGEPVDFAKVCLQQDEWICVGYTDGRGQVTFDITPSATPNHINVTVTKHNFRPHLGNIIIHDDDALVYLWPPYATENEQVNISQTGFPESSSVEIYFDGEYVDELAPGQPWKFVDVPPGDTIYINVWLAKPGQAFLEPTWNPVSVDYFGRVPEDAGPNPSIYSQDDRSSWPDPGGEVTWDNPDIEIDGDTIYVTVRNKGASTNIPAETTLSYCQSGGGQTWHLIGKKLVPNCEGTVEFTFAPIPQSVGFRVDLFHRDESLEDTLDNIGYDMTDTIQLHSPGTGEFEVGNPTCSERYVFIRVKQLNTTGGIWNASIQNYLSILIKPTTTQTVTLFVDPLIELDLGDNRLFEIEFFVDCLRVGGMIINATRAPTSTGVTLDPLWLGFIGGVGVGAVAVGLVVVYLRNKIGGGKSGNT